MSASLLPRLMLVTDRQRTRGRDLATVVAAAVQGGVGIVQIRENDLHDEALTALVRRIGQAAAGATIVVNERTDVALDSGAGLHLPAAASLPRDRSGQPRVPSFGRSAHDEQEARRAADEGASYIVLGTIFPTPSKPGHPGSGTDLVQRVSREVHPIPVFAIGGIRLGLVPQVIHAGAHGVAVCGAILSAADPRRAAEAMTLALEARPKSRRRLTGAAKLPGAASRRQS